MNDHRKGLAASLMQSKSADVRKQEAIYFHLSSFAVLAYNLKVIKTSQVLYLTIDDLLHRFLSLPYQSDRD
jgi:hypothetical protein